MTSRERFRAVMEFGGFDRLPLVEWASWWDLTLERWRKEGLPGSCRESEDLFSHFGLEMYLQDWVGPRKEDCPVPARRPDGILGDGMTYDELRPHLFPRPAIDRDMWRKRAGRQACGEAVLWFTLEGFFWFPREVLGVERHLCAFHEEPELIRRINEDLAEWHVGVIDEICSVCTPDFMTFAEDMSYNHGPMLSKDCFDGFMRPYYDIVVPRLAERGIIPFVDSDGDVTTAAGWFAEGGIKGMLPLERQAGVDALRIREMHPEMRFIGCFDKMTMGRGEQAMRAEFERLLPLASRGGFVLSCDHQTPPHVSYADYRLYLDLFREYAGKAGAASRSRGLG